MHCYEMESGTIILPASGSKLGGPGMMFDHFSMATPGQHFHRDFA